MEPSSIRIPDLVQQAGVTRQGLLGSGPSHLNYFHPPILHRKSSSPSIPPRHLTSPSYNKPESKIMASSLCKIESARANGAKSHGPVTPEGRQISSLNALRHGLVAQTVVLTNESQNCFQQVFQAYIDHFQPVDDIEVDFVEEMAVAKWHQRRAWAIQTAALLRYEGTHRRTYDRAFQSLLKLQAMRKQSVAEQELPNEPNPTNERRNLDLIPAILHNS